MSSARPLHERAPRGGVGVHEGAGGEVILRGAALGEVRGERERGAREADERRRGTARRADRGGRVQLGDRALHGLGDRGGCLVEMCRVDRGQFGHGSGIRVRLREDGPAARLDLDVDADELQRNHDVAEEDARVDLVAAHRLQRDLARHRRIEARVEHVRAHPQLAVLGQRPPRLPHEPHRRRVGALTAIGAHETRVGSEAGRERMLRGEDHG